jgi:hypothetical protein
MTMKSFQAPYIDASARIKKRFGVKSAGGKDQLIPNQGNIATENRSYCVFGIRRPIRGVIDFFRHTRTQGGKARQRAVARL